MTKKKTNKVSEIFEVKKGKKQKIIKKKGIVKTLVTKKGQKKYQNKLLKNFLIVSIVIILLLVAGYFYINSLKTSNYNGVVFTTISEGNLLFYKTTVMTKDKNTDISNNIYLRTKPRDLKKISFDSKNFNLMKMSVINFTKFPTDFTKEEDKLCGERKSVATANIDNLHKVLGMKLIKDENATCDKNGRYSYYNFINSNKTEIKRIGNNCYNIEVNACDIFPEIDKIMAEMILKYNSM